MFKKSQSIDSFTTYHTVVDVYYYLSSCVLRKKGRKKERERERSGRYLIFTEK
jgi:hypothetical protein